MGAVVEMRSKFDSLDKLPIHQQALQVQAMFQFAANAGDYDAVSKRWGKVRRQLVEYEAKLRCEDSGAKGDWDIGLDIVDGLVAAPIGLIISTTQLVLSLKAGEKDQVLEDLSKTWEELKKEGWDKLKEAGGEKASDATRKARELAFSRLRESLLKYLQAVSKRSRKHFVEIIDHITGIFKAGAGVALKGVEILLMPSKITPEWCGLLKEVDREQAKSYNRIFPSQVFMN